MVVELKKSIYKGNVDAIGSKSFAHRLLIAAFLSEGTSTISNAPNSKDIEATMNCIDALGGVFSKSLSAIQINKSSKIPANPRLNCIESGSTLRFFIPISLALTDHVTFLGTQRLIERGIGIYEDIFKTKGISVIKNKDSIELEGKLLPGEFVIDGSVSSQFITGLLFALPILNGDSKIKILPPINSKNYIDITISVLNQFGIEIDFNGNEIFIKGNQKYIAGNYEVEGDYSNSAFLEAFNYFGSEIKVNKLNPDSLQGDKAYIELFKSLNEGYSEIDISNCIDLGPVLFVFSALKHGGKFTGTSRLAIKESDRGKAMQDELLKIGAEIKISTDCIEIKPLNSSKINNVLFDSHNDHRIVMALSLISSIMDIKIYGYEAINKSYPNYFNELKKLGGTIKYE